MGLPQDEVEGEWPFCPQFPGPKSLPGLSPPPPGIKPRSLLSFALMHRQREGRGREKVHKVAKKNERRQSGDVENYVED